MNTTPIQFMAYNPYAGKNGIVYVNHTFETICETKLFNFEGIKFMQLTALRSINDEPIYNHMIVKNSRGVYQLVDMFNYHRMSALAMSKLEIVGNRFQHPEFMELCK